jgi:hypothetical protein
MLNREKHLLDNVPFSRCHRLTALKKIRRDWWQLDWYVLCPTSNIQHCHIAGWHSQLWWSTFFTLCLVPRIIAGFFSRRGDIDKSLTGNCRNLVRSQHSIQNGQLASTSQEPSIVESTMIHPELTIKIPVAMSGRHETKY